jgi:hypothetical protein
MWWIMLLLLASAVGIMVYLGAVIWDTRRQTRLAPRAPMYSCRIHGLIHDKYVVTFELDGVTKEPIKYCPICYEKKTQGLT